MLARYIHCATSLRGVLFHHHPYMCRSQIQTVVFDLLRLHVLLNNSLQALIFGNFLTNILSSARVHHAVVTMGWVQNVTPEVQALSHYQSIIGVCLATTISMCIFVLMRMYLRIFILKTLGSSDIVTACCAVSKISSVHDAKSLQGKIISIVYNILGIWQTRLGLGLPVLLRPKPDIPTYSVVSIHASGEVRLQRRKLTHD